MGRISRACYESSYFHVMVQGINKEYIFKKSEYKRKYLESIEKASQQNDVKIIAYCIMDNHVHLLLFSPVITNLTKVMASVNTKYAKFYNKTLNRCGYVYRDRYRCENIMTQNHLENCIRYIHMNPVEAGLCDSPIDYEFSSYQRYKNKRIEKEIIELISWNYNDYLQILDYRIENYNFIECTNEFGEKEPEKLSDVFAEYRNCDFTDSKVVYKVARELKRRCGAYNFEIAKQMNIKKSKFYNIMKKNAFGDTYQKHD